MYDSEHGTTTVNREHRQESRYQGTSDFLKKRNNNDQWGHRLRHSLAYYDIIATARLPKLTLSRPKPTSANPWGEDGQGPKGDVVMSRGPRSGGWLGLRLGARDGRGGAALGKFKVTSRVYNIETLRRASLGVKLSILLVFFSVL